VIKLSRENYRRAITNWVRKGNNSGLGNASGTTGTSYKDSGLVGEGADDASTGRLACKGYGLC
jgi:hypothetical protein